MAPAGDGFRKRSFQVSVSLDFAHNEEASEGPAEQHLRSLESTVRKIGDRIDFNCGKDVSRLSDGDEGALFVGRTSKSPVSFTRGVHKSVHGLSDGEFPGPMTPLALVEWPRRRSHRPLRLVLGLADGIESFVACILNRSDLRSGWSVEDGEQAADEHISRRLALGLCGCRA